MNTNHFFCKMVLIVSNIYVFLDFKVIAKGMMERGQGGSIVMMSSYLAFRAMEIRSVYCCTKAALDQLTRSLAMELGPHKVRYIFEDQACHEKT